MGGTYYAKYAGQVSWYLGYTRVKFLAYNFEILTKTLKPTTQKNELNIYLFILRFSYLKIEKEQPNQKKPRANAKILLQKRLDQVYGKSLR